GDLLMLPAISHIVGVVVWGHAERLFGTYKPLVLAGAISTAVALLLLAAIGRLAPFWLVVWMAIFGFLPAYFPVLLAHGRSLLLPQLVGRGITLFNIGTIGGTFLVELVRRAVTDPVPAQNGVYPLDASRLVFAAQGLCVLLACAVYARVRR